MVVAGVTGIVLTSHRASNTSSATASPRDLRGDSVILDPGVAPIPVASAQPIADTGSRLLVPSVKLDVPLGALNAVGGQVTPPGFTSAYVIRNMGVPIARSATGTVFVVMHALRHGGEGPGNYLTNVANGTATVAKGATVSIDGMSYSVTGWEKVSKTALAANASIWANIPNRLVMITCLEKSNGTPSTENMVIIATKS
jgi:hypothetical protein